MSHLDVAISGYLGQKNVFHRGEDDHSMTGGLPEPYYVRGIRPKKGSQTQIATLGILETHIIIALCGEGWVRWLALVGKSGNRDRRIGQGAHTGPAPLTVGCHKYSYMVRAGPFY